MKQNIVLRSGIIKKEFNGFDGYLYSFKYQQINDEGKPEGHVKEQDVFSPELIHDPRMKEGTRCQIEDGCPGAITF